MTYVQPHLITAHASLISAPSHGRSRGGATGGVVPTTPTKHWFDKNGKRYYTDDNGNIIGEMSTQAPSSGSVVQRKQEPPGRVLGGQRLHSGSADSSGEDEWRVTGTDKYDKPDDLSQWNPWLQQWERKWLPGEKEAEKQRQIGDVRLAQEQEMYDYKLSAQQRQEVASINNALEDARKSGRFSEAELTQLEQQAMMQRMGIKPMPTPKEEKPEPVFHTDANGREWIQNGNKWDLVDTIAGKGRKDDGQKVDAERRKYILGAVEDADIDPKKPLTMEQKKEVANRAAATWDSLFGEKKEGGGDPVMAMRATDPLAAMNGVQPFADIPLPGTDGGEAAPAAEAAAAPPPPPDEFAAYRRE